MDYEAKKEELIRLHNDMQQQAAQLDEQAKQVREQAAMIRGKVELLKEMQGED